MHARRPGRDGRLDWPELGRRLAATAVPGVEVVADGVFRRTIEIRGEPAVIEVFERYGELLLRVHASHWEELIHLVQRLRRLLSLDAAGGAWDPLEAGVREIVGGRDALHRLVELFGEPVDGLAPLGLTHAFPTAAVLANADLTAAGLAPPVAAAVRAFAAAAEPS